MNTEDKNPKDCAIIQDLLPTYVDGLASDATSAMIEKHIAVCEECRRMLESMREGEGVGPDEAERDAKEIDFLRKSKKKGRRAVVLGVIAALLVTLAAVGAKVYLIGSEYKGDMACDITVDGSALEVGATAADSMHVIRKIDFTCSDGVAQGTVRAVLPGIVRSSGTFDTTNGSAVVTHDWVGDFSFGEEIKEVRMGDRVYWSNGTAVSPKASEVFRAGHEYIGDVSENGALLDALEMTKDLGSLYSELKTDSEPYVWTIILDDDQSKYRPEYLDERLSAYGYVLIGSVGNLDEVDFRYTSNGKTVVKKVTAKEASKFLGRDIKTCRSDAGALAELLEKADLE